MIWLEGWSNLGVFSFQKKRFYCVLISQGWDRGAPLYTEVSSFQGVGIEELHCIQRCPHFRMLE